MPWSAKKWWKHTSASMKDKRSLYLSRLSIHTRIVEIQSAVIRATTHNPHSIDYRNASRVFTWARTSPSSLLPLLRSLSLRATRTKSWAVALKTLLISHGIIIISCASTHRRIGRLPFDLADFQDLSAHAFSAFVRTYFNYLDHRSVFLSSVSELCELEVLVKMQDLVELLLQIQPCGDGMDVGLVLEAMDCVVIEMVEIYSNICSCIEYSSSLKGLDGMRIVRRAVKQREQISSYLGLCRSLGVLNAVEIHSIDTISTKKIKDFEIPTVEQQCCDNGTEIVGIGEWEVFDDDDDDDNPFFCLEDDHNSATPFDAGGNLIELI